MRFRHLLKVAQLGSGGSEPHTVPQVLRCPVSQPHRKPRPPSDTRPSASSSPHTEGAPSEHLASTSQGDPALGPLTISLRCGH